MPLIIKTTGFEQFLDPSGGSYLKALIMGDHGVGKTPFAANWPDPIIADCEKGLLSVASLAVPYAEIKTSKDMDALLDMLRLEGMKPPEKRKYKTLVVDTVDTYQRKLIQERLRSERKESLSGWADWGWLDGKMQALLENVLNLPMNVVVNMHTKDMSEDDGETQTMVQKARLKGDIKDSIFQDFDLIGHMEQSYVAGTGEKKGERVRVRQIRWHSEPKYPALRDRSNKLPRFTDVSFSDIDYWQIFNAITSGLDDLPPSEDVETLDTEDDATEVEGEIVDGGPVEQPKLPQEKPVKKTVAKKAPAKKAAAPAKKAEPKPELPDPSPAGGSTSAAGEQVVAGKDFTPPEPEPDHKETATGETGTDVDPWTGKSTAEAPADETPTATDVEDDAAEALLTQELGAEEVKEEEPPAEVETAPAAPVAAKTVKHCGDQPASMVGKYAAVPGCGVELTPDNAGKAQIAMMKYRTYLCNDDFAKQQASVA